LPCCFAGQAGDRQNLGGGGRRVHILQVDRYGVVEQVTVVARADVRRASFTAASNTNSYEPRPPAFNEGRTPSIAIELMFGHVAAIFGAGQVVDAGVANCVRVGVHAIQFGKRLEVVSRLSNREASRRRTATSFSLVVDPTFVQPVPSRKISVEARVPEPISRLQTMISVAVVLTLVLSLFATLAQSVTKPPKMAASCDFGRSVMPRPVLNRKTENLLEDRCRSDVGDNLADLLVVRSREQRAVYAERIVVTTAGDSVSCCCR